jgi:hypothetical protein
MTARCNSAGIVSKLSGGLSAHCQKRSNVSVTNPPAGPEERVPNLSLGDVARSNGLPLNDQHSYGD